MKTVKKTTSIIAIAAIAALAFTQCKDATSTPAAATIAANDSCATGGLRIAYINSDSLAMGYQLAVDLNNEATRKEETMRKSITERGKALEKDLEDFQRKYKNNAFVSAESAEQQYQQLTAKQQDFQDYAQKMESSAMETRQKMLIRVGDSIQNYIDTELASQYDIILNQASNFHIAQKFNITDQAIKALNARLKK